VDNKRYIAQLTMPEIGFVGQDKISKAKVLVIGAGGLGCPALLYLAGMGVGTLGIVDYDTVHLSNLHRQILYKEIDIGKPKAEVASLYTRQLNSSINIVPLVERITDDNIESICTDYDIVVDCTDNVESRTIISGYGKRVDKPVVFGAVQQFEGMVTVFNKQFTFIDLFPENATHPNISCSQEGILGHVAGHVACLMVNEVIKIILGLEGILSGKVLTTDLKSGRQRTFFLNK
jgi:molybdopterin/thiamine biosynthesis adenylyltransferase